MIVATGTRHRNAENHASCRIDLLIDKVGLKLTRVSFDESLGTDGQESGRDQLFREFFVILGGDQVACDLFADKLVIRFVIVEGVNDIVSVAPGIWKSHVDFFATGFCVASDVEPIAPPAFAELWSL